MTTSVLITGTSPVRDLAFGLAHPPSHRHERRPFLNALQRETGLTLDPPTLAKLSSSHEQSYLDRAKSVVPLPGARELLDRASVTRRSAGPTRRAPCARSGRSGLGSLHRRAIEPRSQPRSWGPLRA
jgi:hypothetical protein